MQLQLLCRAGVPSPSGTRGVRWLDVFATTGGSGIFCGSSIIAAACGSCECRGTIVVDGGGCWFV